VRVAWRCQALWCWELAIRFFAYSCGSVGRAGSGGRGGPLWFAITLVPSPLESSAQRRRADPVLHGGGRMLGHLRSYVQPILTRWPDFLDGYRKGGDVLKLRLI